MTRPRPSTRTPAPGFMKLIILVDPSYVIITTYSVRLINAWELRRFLKKNQFLGHLSHSGDLLLWVGVRHRPSCVDFFFSRTTWPILTKFGM